MHDDASLQALDPAIREALEAQRMIYHAMMRLSAPDWLELDLSTGQFKALMTLGAHQGMTVGEVADALHIGKPAASMLIDRLSHQGYIERSEDSSDRRRTIVVLSPTGAELVERMRQGGGAQLMTRFLQRMNADDLAALTKGMRAVAAIAQREAQESVERHDRATRRHITADDPTDLQSTSAS